MVKILDIYLGVKVSDISYKAVFCVFVVIGSAISAQSVFDFGMQ